MSLQLNDELLSAFLDGEVSDEERLQIETALKNSPEWRTRYHQLVETVNAVRTIPESPLPRDFSQDVLAQIAARQQVDGQSGRPAPVVVAERSTSSVSQRRRSSSSSSNSIWITVAACLLVAVGLGIAMQSGIFGTSQDPKLAQQDPQVTPGTLPDDRAVASTDSVGDPVKPDEEVNDGNRSPFPSVEELAGQRNNAPIMDVPTDDPSMERSPIGIRVNVRTKPGEMKKPDVGMARPAALARSVFNLDPQEDPELDRIDLINFQRDDVLEEITSWVDLNDDGQVSDMEAQQAWMRFMQTEGSVPAFSEEALFVIDQDMNQKISTAEFHLAVASSRWHTSESMRKVWYRLDANADGVWSQDDFAMNARFAPKGMPSLAQQLAQWHALVDRSRDGKVTRLELALSSEQIQLLLKNWEQKILNPKTYDQTTALMSQFDRDGNGQLAGRELMRLKEKHQALAPQLENAGPNGLSAYELYLAIETQEL